MPKIDLDSARVATGSDYPGDYAKPCETRQLTLLSELAGVTQFGVNLTRLPPGAWSSQRHWHAYEDEFAYVLEGEVVLIDDAGEHALQAGACAGFKAGVQNGHHFVNRSDRDVLLLVVGGRDARDCGEYSDIDMRFHADGSYSRKDGSPIAS